MFTHLAEIQALLTQSRPPVAILIDLDSLADRQAALPELTSLRQALIPEIPLLFLADRGDITARLDAVDAGATGYFVNPADLPVLLETLEERALQIHNHRVLIVDDHLPSEREVARWLETRGMITQVLAQPLQILQALNNFQPSLLILSLDLKDIDGLMLAQAVQQHASFRDLPLALLSAQAVGGMFGLYFSATCPQSFAEVMQADAAAFNRFFHAMLDAGHYLAPSAFEAGFVSVAHAEADIAATVAAGESIFRTWG